MKLSEDLQQQHDSGDFGQGLEGYPEDARKLEDELDAAKAHISELTGELQFFVDRVDSGVARSVTTYARFNAALAKTPAQNLASIKAQAINDLISELSEGASVDGIAETVIYVGEAEKFAAKIGGGE